ncbi:MAG: hypothetical protein LKI24_11150, partial [Acidipropionibacterium sp.]|nr:hypothetical protein [Acidipropionibacterium sp.]
CCSPPEVFEKEDGTIEPGVAPNTFMALNELTNSMWTTSPEDSPLARNLLFDRAGAGRPGGHNGPSTIFLVGRHNGAVTFSSAWDVFKIVGRSLAELALDEALTDEVIAYDLANAEAMAAGGTDSLELSSPRNQFRDLAVLRSMGFSRITVGRDFFEKYAVDRMSRAAIIRLLDGHLLDRDPASNLSDEELLQRAVEGAWDSFLDASKIDEYGVQNDITKRLDTRDAPAVQTAKSELREKCGKAIEKLANKRGRVKVPGCRSSCGDADQSGPQLSSGERHTGLRNPGQGVPVRHPGEVRRGHRGEHCQRRAPGDSRTSRQTRPPSRSRPWSHWRRTSTS